MTSTATPQRHDVIKFRPVSRTNYIKVLVTGTSTLCGQNFVHGYRMNSNGCRDSQSKNKAWMIDEFEVVG